MPGGFWLWSGQIDLIIDCGHSVLSLSFSQSFTTLLFLSSGLLSSSFSFSFPLFLSLYPCIGHRLERDVETGGLTTRHHRKAMQIQKGAAERGLDDLSNSNVLLTPTSSEVVTPTTPSGGKPGALISTATKGHERPSVVAQQKPTTSTTTITSTTPIHHHSPSAFVQVHQYILYILQLALTPFIMIAFPSPSQLQSITIQTRLLFLRRSLSGSPFIAPIISKHLINLQPYPREAH